MPRERPLPPATIESVAHEVGKLCRYAESLETSIRQLTGRIRPYDDGKVIPESVLYEGLYKVAPTLPGILKAMRRADVRLQNVEYFVKYTRAVLDQISNDSWSRNELKPYLDSNKKP